MTRFKIAAGVGIVLATCGACAAAQADTITQWTFQNDAVATNNNPAPSTGSGTAGSIGMNVYATPNIGVTKDDVLLGTTGDTGANG
ncbi:MAG TPA: hypothetical protein VMC02_10535, partial [Steroidobacteraceae bacterium]|nr:hypothetical protein [Steroidobacteraceae bacterium]